MFVVALLPVESQKHEPEHVEGSQQRGGQSESIQSVADLAAPIFALERAEKNRVLAEKPRKRRKSRDGQSGRQHGHVSPPNFLAQAAHTVHVLLAAHGVDHAACGKKEQRLEERMRHQMKNTGGEW